MTQPPKRLLETESGALRESLASAKGQLPSDAQLAQLAERLGRLGIVVPVPGAAPTPAAPVPAKSLGVGAKAGLGIAGVGTAAVLAFALTRSHEPPQDAPRPPITPTVEVRSAPPAEPSVSGSSSSSERTSGSRAPARVARPQEPPSTSPEPASAAPAQPPAVELTAPHGERPQPKASASSARATEPSAPAVTRRAEPVRSQPAPVEEQATTAPGRAAPDAEVVPPSEVDLLKRARAAVASNPARALTLARRHGAEFPNGAFAQERDFIAISALVRLGRTGEAKALASSFRARYRRSAYLPQLERLLGSEP